MKKKWKPYLSRTEIDELSNAGYMVRSHWIMPGAYYEHYLIRFGGHSGRDDVFTAMSPRVCYGYFKRNLQPPANVVK